MAALMMGEEKKERSESEMLEMDQGNDALRVCARKRVKCWLRMNKASWIQYSFPYFDDAHKGWKMEDEIEQILDVLAGDVNGQSEW